MRYRVMCYDAQGQLTERVWSGSLVEAQIQARMSIGDDRFDHVDLINASGSVILMHRRH